MPRVGYKSVTISEETDKILEKLVKKGVGKSKSDIAEKAIQNFAKKHIKKQREEACS